MAMPESLLRHRRPVRPLRFIEQEPEADKLGETSRHLVLRTALWQLIKLELDRTDRHTVSSEQFVYFNARDPRRCCVPDVYVKLDVRVSDISTWRVWERGAPEIAVEIASPSDREPWSWEDKLERYHELGVRELIRFDPDATGGDRLHVWDRVEDDLVEREVHGDSSPCLPLALWWVVGPVVDLPAGLRLARDPEGRARLPTPDERIAELEAELRERVRGTE
jgi:Uma2 family endonuclease